MSDYIFYPAIALTGGTDDALDGYDGDELNDKDVGLVVTATAFYHYILDDDSGAAESSPDVIKPDDNAGTKRWILINISDAHSHDGRYYTETEISTWRNSVTQTEMGHLDGVTSDIQTQLNALIGAAGVTYTNLAANGDVGTGSTQVSQGDHIHAGTDVEVDELGTATYDDVQDWLNNTQSAGRFSGGTITAHADAITGITTGGAGSGEFKISGDHTAIYTAALSINVDGSTGNDGSYTVSAGGATYAAGTTTIPVDEAVSDATVDGDINNGRCDVASGTGFVKTTESGLGATVSFNWDAQENIALTQYVTSYVYLDYNAGSPTAAATDDASLISTYTSFKLGICYRSNGVIYPYTGGIYLPDFYGRAHRRTLRLHGFHRTSGGEISEYGTRNIQSTAGVFYRGFNKITTAAKASVDDKFTSVYYDGSNWIWTQNQTQIDNTQYNNIASGLATLSNNKYGVHWVCIDFLGNIYVVYGQGNYTLTEAQKAGVPALVPVIATDFGTVAAKIIIEKSAASFTEIVSAYTTDIPSASPAVHNDLSGLQGGTTDEYYHLTSAQRTDLTDGNACSSHKHDIVEDTTPQLGGDLALNSKNIDQGVILTDDATYQGEVITVTVDDASASFGTPLYCAADFHYERTDADSANTMPCVAIALESGAGSKKVLLRGQLCRTVWNLVAGSIYISCTTGYFTQSAPGGAGDQVQKVGFTLSADTIFFDPDSTVETI